MSKWVKFRSALFVGMGLTTIIGGYRALFGTEKDAGIIASMKYFFNMGWKSMAAFKIGLGVLTVAGMALAVPRIIKNYKRLTAHSQSADAIPVSSNLTSTEPAGLQAAPEFISAQQKLSEDEMNLSESLRLMANTGAACKKEIEKLTNETLPGLGSDVSALNYRQVQERQFQVNQVFFKLQNKSEMDQLGCPTAKAQTPVMGPSPASVSNGISNGGSR